LKRILILFPSTHDALVAEKNWPQSGLPGKLRPIPRSLSSSCGLCLETDLPEDLDPVEILTACKIEWEQVIGVLDKELVVLAENSF